MRWLLLALLLVQASAQQFCVISDFQGLGLTLHNPSERHLRLSQWLTTNGQSCTTEQLMVIWNNLASWAGVADSSELRSKVVYYYGLAAEREKK